MKAGPFTISVLVVSLAMVLTVWGTLAQGPRPGGAKNPATVQQQAQNVERVSHLGGPTNAVAIQGIYAYLGIGPRLVILNVSDPAHPSVVGQTDIPYASS